MAHTVKKKVTDERTCDPTPTPIPLVSRKLPSSNPSQHNCSSFSHSTPQNSPDKNKRTSLTYARRRDLWRLVKSRGPSPYVASRDRASSPDLDEIQGPRNVTTLRPKSRRSSSRRQRSRDRTTCNRERSRSGSRLTSSPVQSINYFAWPFLSRDKSWEISPRCRLNRARSRSRSSDTG